MEQPKLQPNFKKDSKETISSQELLLIKLLYHLLGHIPADLRSLDPEKIRKYLAKHGFQLNAAKKENGLSRLLDFLSDLGIVLGMLFAFDFSYTPEPDITPKNKATLALNRQGRNPALLFNKPAPPFIKPMLKPEFDHVKKLPLANAYLPSLRPKKT
jgi:hypothetical protein